MDDNSSHLIGILDEMRTNGVALFHDGIISQCVQKLDWDTDLCTESLERAVESELLRHYTLHGKSAYRRNYTHSKDTVTIRDAIADSCCQTEGTIDLNAEFIGFKEYMCQSLADMNDRILSIDCQGHAAQEIASSPNYELLYIESQKARIASLEKIVEMQQLTRQHYITT